MRLTVAYQGIAERVGALLNLVPVPVGYSMVGMPTARAIQVAQRTGLLARLADGPATATELAAHAGLREAGTKLLLDALCAAGQLRLRDGERYEMRGRARKWLKPGSDTYVGDFLGDTYHYWDWWGGLEALVREGRSVEMHDRPTDDPYWRSYITGQYQLARLSSAAVAKVVPLAQSARSLLDVAGGHGEFSMALCRQHPELQATVVDLPGSARIGREIVMAAGMSDRVRHIEGDMFQTELGGPHDGALCFNIIHHFREERILTLFNRVAQVLSPGAPLCVLDVYTRPAGKEPDLGAFLGLFFHLTSGADTYSVPQVSTWLRQAGFDQVRTKRLPQLPGLALLIGRRT